MYRLYPSELGAYTQQIITRAVRRWRKDGLPDETISSKIDALTERLERANKKEFIAIFYEYWRK